MIKKPQKRSLSERISNILSTAPDQIDPEDDVYEETAAQVCTQDLSDEDITVNSSQFRKQNLDLLDSVDNKYAGKKISRSSMKESDDDEETNEESPDGDSNEESASDSDQFEEDSYDEENNDQTNDFDSEEEQEDDEETGFKHMSETKAPTQLKKGNSVRNQLSIWENLLEIRIQLQKCLLTANKLPQSEIFTSLNTQPEFKSAVNTTKKNVNKMLDNFLLLQEALLNQYNETKQILKNKTDSTEDSDEDIPSDTEDEKDESEDEEVPIKRKKVASYQDELQKRYDKYTMYRNGVIQKWNEKTRLASGKNSTNTSTVLQQIEYLLGDKEKLIKKTQIKRTDFEIVGKETDEQDTEIYDDTDFYHQLLRELIEMKSGDVQDPLQMSSQWIQLQNLRSKMKRKIDTRATKGRKIRYVVHSKLVNFMAPIHQHDSTDQAKDELFNSLFAKN